MASQGERQIARYAAEIFGGHDTVFTYEHPSSDILIPAHPHLEPSGQPRAGLTSYSAIGLSSTPMLDVENSIRVELVGAAQSRWDFFPNAMAGVARDVALGSEHVEEGAVMRLFRVEVGLRGLGAVSG